MSDQFKNGGIDLDRALGFWVYKAHQASRARAFRAFREHGFAGTPEQWVVLVRLWEEEGLTQSELCERTVSDRPSMTRTLASMERAGWVRRQVDREDARARRVFLTSGGKALRGRLVPLVQEVVADSLAGIPTREVRRTIATLKKVVGNLT